VQEENRGKFFDENLISKDLFEKAIYVAYKRVYDGTVMDQIIQKARNRILSEMDGGRADQ
jgi:hypothetical protein